MTVDKKVKVTYHRDMVHVPSWIHSASGTPIELMASAPLHESSLNSCILLLGGIHGDEPLGTELALKTTEWLKTQTQCYPWITVPCLNIDGYKKNSRINDRGVDINRNYPASNWSPDFQQTRYYPGPHAGSEPETQGVVSLIQEYKPRLIIHCHSWHPCIVCTGEPGKPAANALAQSSGYSVVESIGYETPGSLSQFGWVDRKIPVICIEESDDAVPNSTWSRFADGMKQIFCMSLA